MPSATATPSLESLARITGSAPRMASLAERLQPSTILKVAGEIRAMQAAGRDICDLTVGDFDPKQFPIPERLRDLTKAALDALRARAAKTAKKERPADKTKTKRTAGQERQRKPAKQ